MVWTKEKLQLSNDQIVEAQTPIIISASRATDIPAFYSQWFINRFKEGYIKWKNPFNGKYLYVSFKKARVFVFWTKNPKPMFEYIDFLNEKIPNYYFQFSLNDYDKENYESNVPKLSQRIKTFQELSQKIGNKRVIWRFDPLILTDKIGIDELLRRVENIANELHGYTNKLVFSFLDISPYRKVANNVKAENLKEFSKEQMNEFAKGLSELNTKWNFKLGTCCEEIDLDKYKIEHNKCIDDDLMIELFSKDKVLMDFLGVEIKQSLFGNEITKTKNLKDKGQRKVCGCIASKDIGQYNTCPHGCNYCYANTSKQIALKNYEIYKQNKNQESILGD